jgi:hypothetical protein
MKAAFLLFLLSSVFLGCSSSLKAVVSDANGLHREVDHVRLDIGRCVQVLDGLADRQVPLKKISVIRISPEQTETHKDRLYYGAEIWLLDGNKIQPYATSGGRESGAFINVNCTLLGRIDRAPWSIRLTDVRQIKFVPKE